MTTNVASKKASRHLLLVGIGVIVSATFLWMALRNTDFAQIKFALSSAEPFWIGPFLVSLFAFYWLKSRRWRDLLAPTASVRTASLFPAVMIGYAGTAILPMQMGELVRAYIVSRKHSISYALVLGSIGIERIFDFLTVLAVLGFVLSTGQNVPDLMKSAGYVVAIGCIFAVGMTILLVIRTRSVLEFIGILAGWMPDRMQLKIREQLGLIAKGFQALRHPRLLIIVAINSIVQWILMGLCILFSLWALDISVPPSGAAMVLVATIIGISLPTSPGYVGNIQLAFSLALLPYGVSPEAAVAASVYYHVIAYTSVLVAGSFCLHRYGYNLSELRRRAAGSIE